MYAWARPDYLLDYMSVEELYLYYDYGMEFEGYRATLIINKLGEALSGKTTQQSGPGSDKPDKAAFYRHYGDKIKRPEGGEK